MTLTPPARRSSARRRYRDDDRIGRVARPRGGLARGAMPRDAEHPGRAAGPARLRPLATRRVLVAGNTAVHLTCDRFGGQLAAIDPTGAFSSASHGTVTVATPPRTTRPSPAPTTPPTSGTLTFAPGVTWQTLSIPTLVDSERIGQLVARPRAPGTDGRRHAGSRRISPR